MYCFKKVALVLSIALLLAACTSTSTVKPKKTPTASSTSTTTVTPNTKPTSTTGLAPPKPTSSETARANNIVAAFNSYTFPKTWSKQGAPNSNTPYDNQVDACVASAANLPAPTAAVSSYAFGISPTVSQGSLSAIKGYHVNSWVTFFPDSTDGLNFLAAVSQGKLIPCFRRLNSQLTLVVHPLPPLTLPSVGDKTASYTFVADVQPPTSKSTPTSKSAPSAYSVGVDVVSFAKGNLVTCIIAIQITGSPINKVTLPGNMLDNLLTSTSAGA